MTRVRKPQYYLKTNKYPLTTELLKCAQCNHVGLMYTVCSGIGEEYQKYTEDLSEWIADHEWLTLMCTECQSINVIQKTKWSFDEPEQIDEPRKTDIPITMYYLYPRVDIDIPSPHDDMPDGVLKDYLEAKKVFLVSPKSAAALCRLAIQRLCKDLGEKGENINEDIRELVKKGLPEHIQQALDIVRVIGNEAVHPGEINLDDNQSIARELFGLINEIIDNRIGIIKKQERIRKLYETLPQTKKDGILKRDKPSL